MRSCFTSSYDSIKRTFIDGSVMVWGITPWFHVGAFNVVQGGLEEIQERVKKNWQLPVLLAGSMMLIGGFWLALQKVTPEEPQVAELLAVAGKQVSPEAPEPDLALENLKILEAQAVMNDEQKSLYHLLYARALYLSQSALNDKKDLADHGYSVWQNEAQSDKAFFDISTKNYQDVLAHYEAVEKLQPALIKNRDKRYRIESLLYLGEDKVALELLRELADAPQLRHALMRNMIDDALMSRDADYENIRELLNRYYDEPDLDIERKLWATLKLAEVMMQHGDYRDAVKFLLWRQPLFLDASEVGRLELRTLLGEAQYRSGSDNASERALETLSVVQNAVQRPSMQGRLSRETMARLNLNLGMIEMGNNQIPAARAHFQQVLQHYDVYPMLTEARVSLASANQRLGSSTTPEAWRQLREAIREVKEVPQSMGLKNFLKNVLIDDRNWQRDGSHSSQNLLYALTLLDLEESLTDGLEDESLKARANIHEMIARRRFEQLMEDQVRAGRPAREARLDSSLAWSWMAPETRRDLRMAFERAANDWKQYAQRIQQDKERYGEAVREAALNYGLANNHREEAAMLESFLQNNQGGAERPEVMYRLGMAYLGVGDLPGQDDASRTQAWEKAIIALEELVNARIQAPTTLDAYLPLARAYEYLDQLDAAEKTIDDLLDNDAITPENLYYREGKAMLGMLLYKRGNDRDFLAAAESLNLAILRHLEAVKIEDLQAKRTELENDPGDPDLIRELENINQTSSKELAIQRYAQQGGFDLPRRARFLGMSYLKINESDEDRIDKGALTKDEQDAKESQIKANLELAADAFYISSESLKRRIEFLENAGGNPQLIASMKAQLMNVNFQEADAYYALQQWDRSIRIYEEITRDWADEPRSLMAYVRLINARLENGEKERARQEILSLRDHIKRFSDNQLLNSALPDEFWQDWNRLMNRIEREGG